MQKDDEDNVKSTYENELGVRVKKKKEKKIADVKMGSHLWSRVRLKIHGLHISNYIYVCESEKERDEKNIHTERDDVFIQIATQLFSVVT